MNTTESGVDTFKQLLYDLIGKDELYFFGWIMLAILILLIITACIGCKGCCCRACCCARETRATLYMCKVPKPRGGGQGIPNDMAMISMVRCCYHPRHCIMDTEAPLACHCRRVCPLCNRYLPNSIQSVESPNPACVDKFTSTGTSNVGTDTDFNKASSKMKSNRRPRSPSPSPPQTQDIGFNYRPPPGAWSYTKKTSYQNEPPPRGMGLVDPQGRDNQTENDDAW